MKLSQITEEPQDLETIKGRLLPIMITVERPNKRSYSDYGDPDTAEY
ncbi:MAG: hypothetical protein ACTSPB_16185 [Candidatus Thorarchaeota archaeon]